MKRTLSLVRMLCLAIALPACRQKATELKEDTREMEQTGWTTAVPAQYTKESSNQGTVERLNYDSLYYVRDNRPITKTAYVYTAYGYDETDTETRYDILYILFHTGMRISEFCGLTLSDLDMEKRIINIDHQLQRTSEMEYLVSSTKTNAGTRKIPMTDGVYRCFQAIIEDREAPMFEKMVDGHTGFLFLDAQGMPEVAMHWEHRFNHTVKRYNEIYKVQMPNITPHVCRHTYCSNQAKARMNPKTLQYLMGHSDISVTMNVYTHLGLEDAAAEMARMEAVEAARKEQEKITGETGPSQKMFRVV